MTKVFIRIFDNIHRSWTDSNQTLHVDAFTDTFSFLQKSNYASSPSIDNAVGSSCCQCPFRLRLGRYVRQHHLCFGHQHPTNSSLKLSNDLSKTYSGKSSVEVKPSVIAATADFDNPLQPQQILIIHH